MILKTYKKHLLSKFTKKLLLVSFIFFILVLILNLLEEINFLKDSETNFITPVLLTLLNTPSLLREMLPFIFLISTQFFFMDIYENKEILTLKQFGLDNLSLLKFLSLTSFIYGIFIIIFFYYFSAVCKNQYLKIKNNYTKDNKYLAVITKNGIWIKDTSSEGVVIINADRIEDKFLINLSITKLSNNFIIQKNIIAEKADIRSSNWKLTEAVIINAENNSVKLKNTNFKSNFDFDRINNLFSDMSSLTYFGLLKLKKDYEIIGYSTDELEIQSHKFYSLPFMLMAMTIISTIIMFNNKFQKNILLNLLIGIFFSVLIYYITHFSNVLGANGKLPIILSVWFPIIIIFIISSIGIVRLNEK